MIKPAKNIFLFFLPVVLFLGCDKHHSPNLKPVGNGILVFGAEGDSLQLVGKAADSLSNLLKSHGFYDSDSLWFTISYPAKKEIPLPAGLNEVEQIEPHFKISIGTSDKKRKNYLEHQKHGHQTSNQNKKIEVDHKFWNFWIMVSESRDSILTVSDQW